MKKYLIAPLLLVLCLIQARGQVATNSENVSMPSSEASSLLKSINVPVNLYNGVASVPVPLYTVEANNGAQVPIALNYNASGIKVNEIASSVGLGWQLIAGGAISRVLRDKPDELRTYSSLVTEEVMVDFMVNGGEEYDKEKDLFYFSYPGGSGRMIVQDKSGGISPAGGPRIMEGITLPLTDLDIEFTVNDDFDSYWVITDLAGNKYYFGDTEESREITYSSAGVFQEYLSTWRLTKIVYANQPEDKGILFSYEVSSSLDVSYDSYETRLGKVPFTLILEDGTTIPTGTYYPTDIARENTVINNTITKFLSEITFPKGRVLFSYGEDRLDLEDNVSLDNVEVRDHNDDVVHTIDFVYSYFNSAHSFTLNGSPYGDCEGEECYRLKLDKITRDGLAIREFDYNSDKTFTSTGADAYSLPPRGSYYFDHWGYFNGHEGQGDVYTNYVGNSDMELYNSMDRTPRISCTANMLAKVVFPTGGYQTLEYGYNPKNGGARIEAIKSWDEYEAVVSHTDYVYAAEDENESLEVVYAGQQPVDNDGPERAYFAHSDAASLQFDLNGTTSGYKKVTVVDRMTGMYQEHHFYNIDESDLRPPQVVQYQIDRRDEDNEWLDPIPVSGTEISYSNEYPFVTHSLENYHYGLPEMTVFYDENGEKISSTSYVYEQDSPGSVIPNTVYTLYTEYSEGSGNDRYIYKVKFYNIYPKGIRLDYKIDQAFDNNVMTSEKTTTYIYDGTYKTLVKETQTADTDGFGEAFNSKVLISYADDLGNTSLINRGAIGIPLRQETKVHLPTYEADEYRTSSVSQTAYSTLDSWIYPSTTRMLYAEKPVLSWTDTDLELISTSTYGADGMPESVTDKNDVTVYYDYDEQGYLLSETTDPGLSSLALTTTYTYKPLVGVATVTDPNGRAITYEYDDQGRLHLIRDHDNNIVKRHRYNYVAENNGEGDGSSGTGGTMEVEMYIHGYNKTSQTMYFEPAIIDMYAPDAATYTWTIGDEVVVGKEVSYRFQDAGYYSVNLTISHPDYETYSIDGGVTLYTYDWEINGTPSGPPTACDGVDYTYRVNSVTGANSCFPDQDYQYIWQYSIDGSSWTDLDEDMSQVTDINTIAITWSPASFIGFVDSSVFLKLTVYDTCNKVTRESESIEITLGESCQ